MKGRRANLRAKIGVATAVVVGGGAIAVAAVAASSHGGTPAAQSAGFSRHTTSHQVQHASSQWSMLNTATTSWTTSQQTSFSTLASMHGEGFFQTTAKSKTLAVQRGIVVLATSQFLIVQSPQGDLRLWLLSGNTSFKDVSTTSSGASAMTGNSTAAMQVTQSSYMIPATELMAGNTLTASNFLSFIRAPQTYTVQVAGTSLTVTVTVSGAMAAVSQTATTNAFSTPAYNPTSFTEPAWSSPTNGAVARGDLVLVTGSRSHGVLNAQLVLFVPMSTQDVGGKSTAVNPNPVPANTVGSSGQHW